MIIKNEDIQSVIIEVPEGHKHVRTTLLLRDGTEYVFQEATMANLLRAYISMKTHPTKSRIRLQGRKITERKKGYAEWQLLEEDE